MDRHATASLAMTGGCFGPRDDEKKAFGSRDDGGRNFDSRDDGGGHYCEEVVKKKRSVQIPACKEKAVFPFSSFQLSRFHLSSF
jgi:hypothetical protein